MSTIIQSVTVGSDTERRVVLRQSSLMRKLSIGNSWNVLWIFLRWAVDDQGLNLVTPHHMHLGIMSDPAGDPHKNPLGGEDINYYGIYMPTRFTRYTSPYYFYTLFPRIGKIEGTSLINSGFSGGLPATVSAEPNTRRIVFGVSLTRSSGNVLLQYIARQSSSNLAVDITHDQLVTALNKPSLYDASTYLTSLDSTAAYNYLGTPAGSMAANEGTYGDLNTIVLTWPYHHPALYISDFLWRKVS